MAQAREKVRIAVFDLNGTLYNKSSKEEFYKFICTKQPGKVFTYAQMAYFEFMKKLNLINQTEFKENFFNYLDDIPPKQVEVYAREFWTQEYPDEFNQELLAHVETLRRKGVKIVCATGALELYVKPLFERFRVDAFMGTRVEYVDKTYKVIGEACKGTEKVNRLDAVFGKGNYRIVEAYSDYYEEMFDDTECPFFIKDGQITPFTQGRGDEPEKNNTVTPGTNQ